MVCLNQIALLPPSLWNFKFSPYKYCQKIHINFFFLMIQTGMNFVHFTQPDFMAKSCFVYMEKLYILQLQQSWQMSTRVTSTSFVLKEVATFGCGGASCCARRSESEIDIDRVDKNCCEEVLAALIFTATFRMDCTIEMEISNFQKSR